jgi:hypothetical protein
MRTAVRTSNLTLYYLHKNIIEKNKAVGELVGKLERKISLKNLVDKFQATNCLRRHRHAWRNIIKMYIVRLEKCKVLDWFIVGHNYGILYRRCRNF